MSIFYSTGIPILVPLAFVDLCSKYISNRSLLQNESSRIEGLSEGFNSLPLTLMPILVCLSCVVGAWMLTANEILKYFNVFYIQIEGLWWILDRQFMYPFYIIMAVAILLYFLFRNIVIRFINWLSESCYDRKQVVHPYYTKMYS